MNDPRRRSPSHGAARERDATQEERACIARAVERIVGATGLPLRSRTREALRRELQDHLETACVARGSVERALHEFGDEAEIATALARAHRLELCIASAARIALSLAASALVALAVFGLVNTRLSFDADAASAAQRMPSLQLEPDFAMSLAVALALVAIIMASRELLRTPLSAARALHACAGLGAMTALLLWIAPQGAVTLGWACALLAVGWVCGRLAAGWARVLLCVPAFALTLSLLHAGLQVEVDAWDIVDASLGLVVVWSCTQAIMRLVDRRFVPSSTGECR